MIPSWETWPDVSIIFLIIWTACVVFWNYLNLFGVTCCSYITFDSLETSGLTRPTETDFTVNHGAELSVKSPAVNSIWNQKPVALEWTPKKGRWFNRSSQYFYWVFLDYLMVESSVLVSYCALQWPIMDRAWVGWAGRYSGLMNSAGWQRAATYLFIYFCKLWI